MLMLLGLAALGLAVLTVAADQLVLGAGRLATMLRIAPVVVGVIVIGLGTSAPEFVVSGIAAARGDVGLAAGNLIGSNILNLTMVLGIAALVAPIAVRSSTVRREAPLSVAATVAFAGAVAFGLGPLAGAGLAVAMLLTAVLLVHLARASAGPAIPPGADDPPQRRRGTTMARETARTVLGLLGTLLGAQLLVENASVLAARLGVPQVIIGLTLVAIGTSLPELVTAVQAQRRGASDLLVGNLLGSNLFNSLTGGAIVGLLGGHRPVDAGPAILLAMVLVALLAWALLGRGHRVTRTDAYLLLGAYLLSLPLLAA